MKRGFVFLAIALALGLSAPAVGGSGSGSLMPVPSPFGPAPLYFIRNQGQAAPEARFYAKTKDYTLWLTKQELVFDRTNGAASGLVFKNINSDVALSAVDPSDYRISYFYGGDESGWITDVPTSRAVLYTNLYDGVDLKVYGTEKEVEYDWVVRPGADPSDIRFAYDGAPATGINIEGDLVVKTSSGEIRHRKPAAYQVIDGRQVAVKASFRNIGRDEFAFAIGVHDRRFALIIDPVVLVSSTYLGGYSDDLPFFIKQDNTGAVYISGFTASKDFPPYHVSQPRADGFVTKLSPDGQSLIYSDFFPVGTAMSPVPALAVDKKGSVYLAGTTTSRSFPLKNAFQTTNSGRDEAFFLKLTPDGKGLVFSSYLGGSGYDEGKRIALDASGSVYVAGETNSMDFPTLKAYKKISRGNWNAFVSKFASDGKTMIYSTYLGGSSQGELELRGLTVDSTGAAYLSGETEDRDFPVQNAFQPKYGGGGTDCFITKLSPSGDRLDYSSYLGGSSADESNGVAVDSAGAAYLTGAAEGPFPVKNAFQKSRKGNADAFVTKFAPNGKTLIYSTYLGGFGKDYGLGIAVDENGNAYITGYTTSPNFPIKDGYQTVHKGPVDAFLTILAPDGKSLIASTYFGGSYQDYGYNPTVGADGTILMVGATNSLDLPTLKPYQKSLKNGYDG
jgi:hypothetical protein